MIFYIYNLLYKIIVNYENCKYWAGEVLGVQPLSTKSIYNKIIIIHFLLCLPLNYWVYDDLRQITVNDDDI